MYNIYINVFVAPVFRFLVVTLRSRFRSDCFDSDGNVLARSFVLGKSIQAGLIIYHEVNAKFAVSARKTYYLELLACARISKVFFTFFQRVFVATMKPDLVNVCESKWHCLLSHPNTPKYNQLENILMGWLFRLRVYFRL